MNSDLHAFSRRALLKGATASASLLATPETLYAKAAAETGVAWGLATRDLDGDVAPHVMRPVSGRLPAGLEGTLFRNGPAKFRRPGGTAAHWFDGDGLMRAYRVQDGQAVFDARFADTPKRRRETQLDAVVTPGFGTLGDDRAQVERSDDASPANIAVMRAGTSVWALWEVGSPLAMSADDLSTRGFVTLREDLRGMPFQAHPRHDPDGSIWNIGVNGSAAVIWHLAADRSLNRADILTLPRASYIHDFTATARHLVIVLQPLIYQRNGFPFIDQYMWQGELGTLVVVIDKADLSHQRIYELPSFSFFHLGDAWEDLAGTIRFDVARYPDPTFALEGGKRLIEGRSSVPGVEATLERVTLTADGRASLTSSGVSAEFPHGDPRRAGLSQCLTVHVSGQRPEAPLPSTLATWNWDTGVADRFDFGAEQIVEEPLMVPKPGSADDAWVVVPTLNLAAQASELHLFEVGRLSAGPVASLRADVAVPVGFHGTWA